MSDHLAKLVESAGAPNILVVGDLILDRYVWGEAGRISPEGPIPVLRVTSEEERPGGAGNVVTALAHLGAKASVCGVIGSDHAGEALAEQLDALVNEPAGVIRQPGRPTTVKTRYIGYVQSARRGIQHMLRVDNEITDPVPQDIEQVVLEYIASTIPKQQAVILSDYGKGMLTERVIARTIELAHEQGIPVVTDPKIGRPYSVYRGSNVLTPNRYEMQLATGIAPQDEESIRRAAQLLLETVGLQHVVITLDRDGMFLAGADEPGLLIPTRPREVFDVTGAGDMVVSVIALMLASGAGMRDAVALANVAAGIEVTKIGAAPVSREEIIADLLGGEGIEVKLKSAEQAVETVREAHRANKKIVWTNGCFDILHVGHYEYLRFARRQGDILIVGLNSDESVRRIKGPKRPITNEGERVRILAALDVVDAVVIFEEDTPQRMIELIRPDIIVKGAHYRKEEVVGGEFVESYGGQIVLAPIIEGVSTTGIIQRVIERHTGEVD